mmetsp:Transcript_104792/g.208235  ORF Transcript_104792/g.208235 Transcript_104792/m.208235 type:complete len:325 (-) Transcript_104792:125-1099(-)
MRALMRSPARKPGTNPPAGQCRRSSSRTPEVGTPRYFDSSDSEEELNQKWTPSKGSGVGLRNLRKGELLASGAFGSVHQVQDAVDGTIYAVKVAKADRRHNGSFPESLRRELEICRKLNHPNIICCLGHRFENGELNIYFEFAAGGSLRQALNQFGPLQGPLHQKATRALLNGLHYLHTHTPPVVHRDVKGANVMVDISFCMKLGDFGCSKCKDTTKTFSSVGTLHWMAPEVIKQTEQGHGRMVDIWSFGCVILEMATAADPWGKDAFDNMMHAMKVISMTNSYPPIPDNLSPGACELVKNCLRRDPAERLSTSQLLSLQDSVW